MMSNPMCSKKRKTCDIWSEVSPRRSRKETWGRFHQESDGIQDQISKITEGSNGIQDLLSNFTMESDWIMDPIQHLVERSSGIIDPTLGSTDMPTYHHL